jgi:hypothetical protein
MTRFVGATLAVARTNFHDIAVFRDLAVTYRVDK